MKINKAIELALGTVSVSSARIYSMTYKQWREWCKEYNHNPSRLSAEFVGQFLVSRNTTHSTRQRQMSALRKLAKIFSIHEGGRYKSDFEYLEEYRIPVDNMSEDERPRLVLSPEQVHRILSIWTEDNPLHCRNFALFATAFYTGLRLNELVSLKWTDLDEHYGVLRIRHGKGDQYREVTIYPNGEDDVAYEGLSRWRRVQRQMGDCYYIFIPLRRGGHIFKDKALTSAALSKIINITCERSEVDFRMHDARRTLATTLLLEGAPVKDVQDQLGHRSAATTIQKYVFPANARKRRESKVKIYE